MSTLIQRSRTLKPFLYRALLLLLAAVSHATAGETVLFDFDQPGLADRWSAAGKIEVVRGPVPGDPPDKQFAPFDHGARITTPGGGGFFSKPGTVPGNWRSYGELKFWVFRAPAGPDAKDDSSTLEIRLHEADGKTRFWRKLVVDHRGWKQYRVPLAWMRWGDGRIPRWDRIDRLGFWFRDPADLDIDSLTVVDGNDPLAFHPPADELRKVAFPAAKPGDVTLARRDHTLLLTNAPELQVEELLDHLSEVSKTVFRDLEFLEPPASPAPLIVFATSEQYRVFTPRLAQWMNSVAVPPRSAGFTVRGIATSSWDARQGTLRSVYTHEFVHALLTPALRLQNKSEWLHEGLASHYQLKFHPQDDLSQIVSDGLADPRAHLPLQKLCDGSPIPTNRYWQAVTVVLLLMEHDAYRRQLPALLAAFQKSGSTDLAPHLESVLKTDWKRLTADWRTYCEQAFRSNDEPQPSRAANASRAR